MNNLVEAVGSCEIATNLIETGAGVDAEVSPNHNDEHPPILTFQY